MNWLKESNREKHLYYAIPIGFIFTILAVSTFGAAGIIVFGDVMVCAVLIIWILKRLIDKKRGR